MFQLIVLLKPDFNYWSNFTLSWADKVTTWTQSFVSVILNLLFPVELAITQVDDDVQKRLTLQLINSISKVLQKLLQYFNGTVILTPFALLPAEVLPVIFTLDLNNLEPARLPSGWSLKYCDTLLDVFE